MGAEAGGPGHRSSRTTPRRCGTVRGRLGGLDPASAPRGRPVPTIDVQTGRRPDGADPRRRTPLRHRLPVSPGRGVSLRYLTPVRRAHHVTGVEASAAVQNNTAVMIMEHGWRHWLGVCAAATVLASGLASIFHRGNATAPQRQSWNHCGGGCPCGTIGSA